MRLEKLRINRIRWLSLSVARPANGNAHRIKPGPGDLAEVFFLERQTPFSFDRRFKRIAEIDAAGKKFRRGNDVVLFGSGRERGGAKANDCEQKGSYGIHCDSPFFATSFVVWSLRDRTASQNRTARIEPDPKRARSHGVTPLQVLSPAAELPVRGAVERSHRR